MLGKDLRFIHVSWALNFCILKIEMIMKGCSSYFVHNLIIIKFIISLRQIIIIKGVSALGF